MISLQQTLGITNFLILNKGRASQNLQEEIDDDSNDDQAYELPEHASGETFEILKAYLPPSVLTFILDPNPFRFINPTP